MKITVIFPKWITKYLRNEALLGIFKLIYYNNIIKYK